MDLKNCGFGEPSALTDFPGKRLLSLQVRLSPDIWIQPQTTCPRDNKTYEFPLLGGICIIQNFF